VRSLPEPPYRPADHPVDVGQRTEAAVIAELVKRGYVVLTPFGVNHRYDLVLDCGGTFIRAQCKTGRLRNGAVRFKTQSVRCNSRRAYIRGYAGEIDVFLVYCAETGGTYAVPVDEAQSEGTLRVAPTKNGQAQGIRWAAEYELPA